MLDYGPNTLIIFTWLMHSNDPIVFSHTSLEGQGFRFVRHSSTSTHVPEGPALKPAWHLTVSHLF